MKLKLDADSEINVAYCVYIGSVHADTDWNIKRLVFFCDDEGPIPAIRSKR